VFGTSRRHRVFLVAAVIGSLLSEDLAQSGFLLSREVAGDELALPPLSSSFTRSTTASELSRKSADVPSLTRCFTPFMKLFNANVRHGPPASQSSPCGISPPPLHHVDDS